MYRNSRVIVSEWGKLYILNHSIMANCPVYSENDLLAVLSASYRSTALCAADIIMPYTTGVN